MAGNANANKFADLLDAILPEGCNTTPVLRAEYIEAVAGARRSPNTFIRFIRDRVIETQRDILRLLS